MLAKGGWPILTSVITQMQMLLAIEGQKKSTPNSYTTWLCIDEKNQYAEFLIKISIRIPT